MTTERSDDPHPPQPPDIARRVTLPLPQLVGVAAMALVPVLAALGNLDERWATHRTVIGAVDATVEYPTRFRAKLTRPMTIHVINRSNATLDRIDVTFGSDYLERFTSVRLTPPPRDALTVSFAPVPAGEHRRIHLDFEADRVGRHEGRIVIRAGNRAGTVPVRTTVLP